MKLMKFRPSSHSTDCTIVATYNSEETARKVGKKTGGYCFGNKVAQYVWNGTWEDVDEVIAELSSFDNESVHVYHCYQEIQVEVYLPKGATAETIPLLLTSDQLKIVRKLSQFCKPKKEKVDQQTDKLVFNYKGEKIFYSEEDMCDEEAFFFDGNAYSLGKEIKVKVIEEV